MSDLPSTERSARILLVEDNDDDVYFTKRALMATGRPIEFHHVDNGEECLAFLRKQKTYVDVPSPDLVLLDLNLPVMDGREVMTAIAADEALRHLPVVVLTTSRELTDVNAMYRLRCNSYVAKPIDYDRFDELIRGLASYWLSLVLLPDLAQR